MCPNNNIQNASATNEALVPTIHGEKGTVADLGSRVTSTRKWGEGSEKWSDLYETMSPSQQFIFLTVSMFFFFGIHNLLQEAIVKVPGFEGVMLTYMEVLG